MSLHRIEMINPACLHRYTISNPYLRVKCKFFLITKRNQLVCLPYGLPKSYRYFLNKRFFNSLNVVLMIGNGIFKTYTKVNDFNEMLNGNCHKCNCYHKVKQIVGMPILLGWFSRFIGNSSQAIVDYSR